MLTIFDNYFNHFYFKKSPVIRWCIAFCIYFIALFLRLEILPLNASVIFITFYPATVACFYLCGIEVGFFISCLSALTAYYFFAPPHLSFAYSQTAVIACSVYFVFVLLIGLVVQKLQSNLLSLKISEQRYLDILEHQSEWICRFKINGTMLYVNESFCDFFGSPKKELIGKKWYPLVYQDDVPFINEQLAKITVDNPIAIIENRVISGNGEIRWGHFVNKGFFDENGKLFELQSVGRDVTDKKLLESQNEKIIKELRSLYYHAPCGYHSLDFEGKIIKVNQTELAWLGYTKKEMIGKYFTDFLTQDGQALFNKSYPPFLAQGHIENLDFDLICKDGSLKPVNMSATVMYLPDGQMLSSRSVVYDFSERRIWEKQLKDDLQNLHRLNLKQHLMLHTDLIGIAKLNNLKFIWFNPTISTMFGYLPQELENQSIGLLHKNYDAFLAFEKEITICFEKKEIYRNQFKMRKRDGSIIWVNVNGVMVSEKENESLWIMDDVTDKKTYQDKIEQIAYHDILTGLPNRLLVNDRLNQAIAFANRSGKMLAVCYLDLDGFKPVNDTFGHEAGDFLLKEISQRMQSAVRSCDTVGRLGGDEFILVLNELESQEEYRIVLDRVFNSIQLPIQLDNDKQVFVGASIGVAFYPTDDKEADMLLRYADEAMYKAKKDGRNRIYLYNLES